MVLLFLFFVRARPVYPGDLRTAGRPAIHFAGLRPPPAEPALAAPVTPVFTEDAFIASDGTRLPLRKWLPRGPVKAVVLALHGFNDYSNGFEMPAKLWASRGVATYAYDQRGFGGAPGRGLWAGEGRLALDAIVASRILRRAYPGRKLVLLGESMGGAVALLAATGAMTGIIPEPDGMPKAEADGIVLSAPAVWGRATMDLLPRLALFAGVRLFPDMTLTGRGLQIGLRQSRDAAGAGARPDGAEGCAHRHDVRPGRPDGRRAGRGAAALRCRSSYVRRARPAGAAPGDGGIRRAAAARSRRSPPACLLSKGYHLLLRDLDGEGVAADVAGWIADPGAPLPSHTDAAAMAAPWPPPAPAGK